MMPVHPTLAEIVRRDSRYRTEAYEFIYLAFRYAQKRLGRGGGESDPDSSPCHLTGRELLDAVRALALRDFGRMAWIVFRIWGIHTTDDLGEVVFNLVDAGLMKKADSDSREEFHDVFDLAEALRDSFEIPAPTRD